MKSLIRLITPTVILLVPTLELKISGELTVNGNGHCPLKFLNLDGTCSKGNGKNKNKCQYEDSEGNCLDCPTGKHMDGNKKCVDDGETEESESGNDN